MCLEGHADGRPAGWLPGRAFRLHADESYATLAGSLRCQGPVRIHKVTGLAWYPGKAHPSFRDALVAWRHHLGNQRVKTMFGGYHKNLTVLIDALSRATQPFIRVRDLTYIITPFGNAGSEMKKRGTGQIFWPGSNLALLE